MYNYNYYYDTLIPEERKAWRSAAEIEMSALAHENRRILSIDGDYSAMKPGALAGILTFLKAPLQLLATLIG